MQNDGKDVLYTHMLCARIMKEIWENGLMEMDIFQMAAGKWSENV